MGRASRLRVHVATTRLRWMGAASRRAVRSRGGSVPRSLLGLWAFLMVASSVMFCVGLLVAFLVDYLYLSGGHW